MVVRWCGGKKLIFILLWQSCATMKHRDNEDRFLCFFIDCDKGACTVNPSDVDHSFVLCSSNLVMWVMVISYLIFLLNDVDRIAYLSEGKVCQGFALQSRVSVFRWCIVILLVYVITGSAGSILELKIPNPKEIKKYKKMKIH